MVDGEQESGLPYDQAAMLTYLSLIQNSEGITFPAHLCFQWLRVSAEMPKILGEIAPSSIGRRSTEMVPDQCRQVWVREK